jgi:1-phosphofructokinase
MTAATTRARVVVFNPHPLLGVTIERRGADEDDVHFHAAGQGVWVARMAAEMGADPLLCAFNGGEPGRLLAPLLDRMEGDRRLVETAAPTGCYVIDRRSGEREFLAQAFSEPPTRHEVDDLFSLTCAAALNAEVLMVCGALPQDAVPVETYGNLVKDVRAGGTRIVTDISSPQLDAALEGEPDVVKLDDWQLAASVGRALGGEDGIHAAISEILERGAKAVIFTRGKEASLVCTHERRWELTPPQFEGGASEGSGDSMVGALCACLARGLDWEESLRLAAAAGATNFLRHGLGSGDRAVIEELVSQVRLEEISA